MPLIEVEVDGLPTPVDAERWESEQSVVEEEVRAARAELRLPESDAEAYMDFDELEKTEDDDVLE